MGSKLPWNNGIKCISVSQQDQYQPKLLLNMLDYTRLHTTTHTHIGSCILLWVQNVPETRINVSPGLSTQERCSDQPKLLLNMLDYTRLQSSLTPRPSPSFPSLAVQKREPYCKRWEARWGVGNEANYTHTHRLMHQVVLSTNPNYCSTC